ncbi:Uncharacterised protein [Bordetella pertussis]|nr:Uncharacterised protein [Bordetella pertussis]CFW85352.1 Uncharacterised protein [Bordetella pertussis]
MAQPRRADAMVDDGIVGRMEHRIADTADGRRQHQHGIAAGRADQHRRQDEAGQSEPQHGPRADAVDDKARGCLPEAGDHVEHRHQQAQPGEIQSELRAQRHIQRGQHQLEEMGRRVRHAYQQDDLPIAPAQGGAIQYSGFRIHSHHGPTAGAGAKCADGGGASRSPESGGREPPRHTMDEWRAARFASCIARACARPRTLTATFRGWRARPAAGNTASTRRSAPPPPRSARRRSGGCSGRTAAGHTAGTVSPPSAPPS